MHHGGKNYSHSAMALRDQAFFHSAESKLITPYCAEHTVVFHQTASVFWADDYHRWRDEQDQLTPSMAGDEQKGKRRD